MLYLNLLFLKNRLVIWNWISMKLLILVLRLLLREYLFKKTIAMSNVASVSPSIVQQWIADKLEPAKIQEELIALGYDATAIETHLKEFNRAKSVKRAVTGFIFLFVGAFLGFISCLLTIINPVPELYYWILYGLTSVAVLIICTGLYFVFE